MNDWLVDRLIDTFSCVPDLRIWEIGDYEKYPKKTVAGEARALSESLCQAV